MEHFASHRSYPAKLLLFGEYTLMNHSHALCIPVNEWSGKFEKYNSTRHNAEMHLHSIEAINPFVEYLKLHSFKSNWPFSINFDHLEAHLNQGIFFNSSIKTGYGLGSSGALVAAFYDNYCESINIEKPELKQLIRHLSLLESYFHGSSSGLDPLCSYLNTPLFVDSKGGVERTTLQDFDSEVAVFLIDSHQKRKTAPLVATYKEKSILPEFQSILDAEVLPLNNACIKHFIRGNAQGFLTSVASLSRLQLKHFMYAIPKSILPLWKNGIDRNIFYMKLCGAGGGGYFLGFTTDLTKAKELINHHHMDMIVPEFDF